MSRFSAISGVLAGAFIAAPFLGMFGLFLAKMMGVDIQAVKWDFMGLSFLSVLASLFFGVLFLIGIVVSRGKANG